MPNSYYIPLPAAKVPDGQLVDLDGDGTPDVAVVPLGNAMAQMGRGGQQNGPA